MVLKLLNLSASSIFVFPCSWAYRQAPGKEAGRYV
jgi:hypothetical protein